jgi:hypothetical protein
LHFICASSLQRGQIAGVSEPTSVTVLTMDAPASLWSPPASSLGRFSLPPPPSVSPSDGRSTSHQGDVPPHSDAVWKDDDLEGRVHVHSEAVTKSSSDLLSSAGAVFRLEYHSCGCKRMIRGECQAPSRRSAL